MTEADFAAALANPASLVLTVIVAAVTAAVTARLVVGRAAAPPVAARPATPPLRAAAADHGAIIAAVAAAVYATYGAHRIIHIGPAGQTSGWTSEMRSKHHTSHSPRP